MATLAIQVGILAGSMAIEAIARSHQKVAPVDKGRFDDLRVQGSEYGTIVPIVIGKMRLAGTIVWASLVKTVVTTTPGRGGKGGTPPTPATNNYAYYTSLAIQVCRGPVANGIRRIWDGPNIIWNLDATNLNDDVTGLIDPVGTYPSDLDDPRSYYHFVPTPSLTTGSVAGQVAWGGNAHIRTYNGTNNQEIDSLLSAQLGTAAQAYRNRCCFVVDSYQFQGGQQPQFTVEVDEGTTTVDQAVIKLFALVNVSSGSLDVTALSGIAFTGCVINSVQEVRQKLEELQIAYNFDFVEQDGKVKAVVRSNTVAAVIPSSDLRAYSIGDTQPETPALVTRVEEKSLPRTVVVNYLDQALDYHNGSQQDSRQTGNTENPETVTLGIVLSAADAKAIASRVLYTRHMERKSFEWTTSCKWLKLAPTDVVQLQLPAVTHTVRVTSMEFAAPGLVKFKGVASDQSVYNQNVTGADGSGYSRPTVQIPGNTLLGMLDVPPLRAVDAGKLGVYVAACGRAHGAWQGAFLYKESIPSSGSYDLVTSFPVEATMGIAPSAIPGCSDPSVWDRVNYVDVDVYSNGTLSSAAESDVLAQGLNVIVVGKEVMQFATATALTPDAGYASKWRLSTLLRGRQGTEWAIGGHGSNETAVLLDDSLKFVTCPPTDVGSPRNYKAATSGQAIVNAPVTAFTFSGNSLKPLSVANIQGSRNSYGDVIFDWLRRTRLFGGLYPGSDVTLGEEEELYQADIMNGASVVRTLTVRPGDGVIPLWQGAMNSQNTAPTYTLLSRGGITAAANGDPSFTTYAVWESTNLLDGPGVFQWTFGAAAFGNSMDHFGLATSEKSSATSGALSAAAYWFSMTSSISVSGAVFYTVKAEGDTASQQTQVMPGEKFAIVIQADGTVEYHRDYLPGISHPFFVSTRKAIIGGEKFRAYGDLSYLGPDTPPYGSNSVTIAQSLINNPRPEALYTKEMQVQDFGSTQSSLTVRVYQMSSVVGRGQVASATV